VFAPQQAALCAVLVVRHIDSPCIAHTLNSDTHTTSTQQLLKQEDLACAPACYTGGDSITAHVCLTSCNVCLSGCLMLCSHMVTMGHLWQTAASRSQSHSRMGQPPPPCARARHIKWRSTSQETARWVTGYATAHTPIWCSGMLGMRADSTSSALVLVRTCVLLFTSCCCTVADDQHSRPAHSPLGSQCPSLPGACVQLQRTEAVQCYSDATLRH
jgi:hypothetical protein